jgi:hypothetical protein
MLEQLLFITFKSETSLKNSCVLSVAACQIFGLHVLLDFFDYEQKQLKLHVSFCYWSLAGPYVQPASLNKYTTFRSMDIFVGGSQPNFLSNFLCTVTRGFDS